MTIIREPTGPKPSLALQPLRPWTSAEQFRKGLLDNVQSIQRGKVGTLTMKNKTIRMLSEEDFQELYGMAQEIDRLRDGIEIILAAAVTVQETRTDSAVITLTKAALALGRVPVLPTRRPSKEFSIDQIPVDEQTETDTSFDFNDVKRPF